MKKTFGKSFSCKSSIEHGTHLFIAHTGNLKEQNRVVSEIFEEGRYVATRTLEYEVRSGSHGQEYEFLSDMARKYHSGIAEEIEALFTVSNKIIGRQSAEAHYQLAVIFLNKSFLDEAEKHFKLAIQKMPTLLRAHFGLAIINLKRKKYEEAIKLLQLNKDVGKNYPDFHNHLGVCYLLNGNYSKAIASFKKAVEMNNLFIEGQLNLGIALYFSALNNVADEEAVGVPARVTIYLKQLMAKHKYKSIDWQNRFKEMVQILKANNHQLIKVELRKFIVEITNLSSEKDKIYEFFLRFMYGGRELREDNIAAFEEHFDILLREYEKYPDVWNDIGIFNLIKSRMFMMKAIDAFEKASLMQGENGEGRKNFDLIKGKEKGFLLLLRAILKSQQRA